MSMNAETMIATVTIAKTNANLIACPHLLFAQKP